MFSEEVLDTFQRCAVEVAGRVIVRVSLGNGLGNALERVEHHPRSLEPRYSTQVQSQIGPERSLDVMKVGLRAKTDDGHSSRSTESRLLLTRKTRSSVEMVAERVC